MNKKLSVLGRLMIVVLMMIVGNSVYAQVNCSVRVKLLDDKTGEPVAFATVSLTPKGAKEALKYALNDDKGMASITKVPAGNYTFKAEIMGYKTHEQQIEVE